MTNDLGLKSVLKSIFHSVGLEVRRKTSFNTKPENSRNEHMQGGLVRSNSIIPQIKTVVDIGAAKGSWSTSTLELWPEANYLLLEPLEERKPELETLVKTYPNFFFVPAAAGREKGEISFYVADDLDGSGVANETVKDLKIRKVKVVSIDDEIKRLKLKGPYLVKLDTHGFEVPILEGCREILNDVSIFIIECYGFQIADKSLLFWEMCQYMDDLGYRLIDIVDVMNRPMDGAFWQCDAFFIKKNHPIFKYASYS